MTNARDLTNDIFAQISEAFAGKAEMKSLWMNIEDLIEDRLREVKDEHLRTIAGPPAIHLPPEPPPVPPSRDLLRKYIRHVGLQFGQNFIVTFRQGGVEFTDDELTELLTLETEAIVAERDRR